MTQRIRPGIVVAAFATALLVGLSAPLRAQEACSDASLQGTYAFNVQGANVSNPSLPPGAFAAVGRNTYDGKGQLKGSIVVGANGAIIPATYTGTYTVNADCSGVKTATLSIGAVVEFFFVVGDDRREIQMIATQAGPPGALADGLTVAGSARRVVTPATRRK